MSSIYGVHFNLTLSQIKAIADESDAQRRSGLFIKLIESKIKDQQRMVEKSENESIASKQQLGDNKVLLEMRRKQLEEKEATLREKERVIDDLQRKIREMEDFQRVCECTKSMSTTNASDEEIIQSAVENDGSDDGFEKLRLNAVDEPIRIAES